MQFCREDGKHHRGSPVLDPQPGIRLLLGFPNDYIPVVAFGGHLTASAPGCIERFPRAMSPDMQRDFLIRLNFGKVRAAFQKRCYRGPEWVSTECIR